MVEKLKGYTTDITMINKIDELVDAINTIQKEREAEWFEIKEWIGILEAVRKSVNVHEKQIDELQMKVEPEKCETRPANVQSDTESRPENVLTKTLRMDKEFAEDECARLHKELERTRKALAFAKSKLNGIHRLYSKAFYTREDWLQVCMEMVDKANTALEQITATLENKNGNC